jgi:hypothetical protein
MQAFPVIYFSAPGVRHQKRAVRQKRQFIGRYFGVSRPFVYLCGGNELD